MDPTPLEDDVLRTPHPASHARAPLSRRELLRMLAAAGGLAGCGGLVGNSDGNARLSAKPGVPTGSATPGIIRLGSGDLHDGYLYVPASYQPGTPLPLVLGLHGAGGNVTGPFGLLGPYAEADGFLIVAVNSSDNTWDGVTGAYGPDVAIINTALQRAFDRVNVDSARVAVQGFSDGASYALGLGVANGDLFKRMVANSPGFLHESSSERRGKPELFISHGVQDEVLDISTTSRPLVQTFRTEGYQVTYLEFQGGHSVPAEVAQAAVTWLLR